MRIVTAFRGSFRPNPISMISYFDELICFINISVPLHCGSGNDTEKDTNFQCNNLCD
ncbi:hypothetical protein SAMN05443582_103387 [Phyllobacterium sp. OV277]|nr:hypothetical protein SAMN05443582_103387 [Phyllobacterium sp. OV277]